MLNLTNSFEFVLLYLIILLITAFLSVMFYWLSKKEYKLSKLKILIAVLLLLTFIIHVIDSIPYLFSDIQRFPFVNIIFSSFVLFLSCFSTCFYYVSLLEPDRNKIKEQN
ncbi:MAG: hypothetical protein ACTSRI_21190 [Promethearchaeota archaeon]